MSDDDLIARLRSLRSHIFGAGTIMLVADRIETLVKERDALKEFIDRYSYAEVAEEANRAERLEEALREIAAEASVPVRTKKKGGIKHKWMYRGWRKIAVERIDIARAALKGDDHE